MADVAMVVAFLILAMIVVLYAMTSALVMVSPYEQAIYIRAGKFVRVLNSGINFVTPLMSNVVKFDLREKSMNVSRVQAVTKDNQAVMADAVMTYKVINPQKAYFQVTNFQKATEYLAQSSLKDALGSLELSEISSKRNALNYRLKSDLDEAADKWGVMVVGFEIKSVVAPDMVSDRGGDGAMKILEVPSKSTGTR